VMRLVSTLKCFDWIASTMRLLRPLRWKRSTLLVIASDLPAHSLTELLQGAGEAAFFLSLLTKAEVSGQTYGSRWMLVKLGTMTPHNPSSMGSKTVSHVTQSEQAL
jgi:hypothetical protein